MRTKTANLKYRGTQPVSHALLVQHGAKGAGGGYGVGFDSFLMAAVFLIYRGVRSNSYDQSWVVGG